MNYDGRGMKLQSTFRQYLDSLSSSDDESQSTVETLDKVSVKVLSKC